MLLGSRRLCGMHAAHRKEHGVRIITLSRKVKNYEYSSNQIKLFPGTVPAAGVVEPQPSQKGTSELSSKRSRLTAIITRHLVLSGVLCFTVTSLLYCDYILSLKP